MRRRLFLLAGLICLNFTSAHAQLTGYWTDNLGGKYKIRQNGNRVCWFMDWSPEAYNVFCGWMSGSTIEGDWSDLPGARVLNAGVVVWRVEDNNRIVRLTSSGYSASVLTRDRTTAGRGGDPTTDPVRPPTPPPAPPPYSPPPSGNGPGRAAEWTTLGYQLGMTIPGQRTTFTCQPGNYQIAFGGKDGFYTGDSSICTAAAHAGYVTRLEGGTATIEWKEGRGEYYGSLQNGIRTNDWIGSYRSSFIFVGNPVAAAPPTNARAVEWKTSGWDLGMTIPGQRVRISCPPGNIAIAFGGKDGFYSADSSVCTAAAHDGYITRVQGGTATVEWSDGRGEYFGDTKNGIQTSNWPGSYRASFAIVGN